MDFEPAFALGATIAEDLPGPPGFKTAAAPNADQPNMRQFERAINPAPATPFRRAHIPIRVVVEGDDHCGGLGASRPERAEVMEIAGTEEKKWRKVIAHCGVEGLDDSRRRRKAKLRSPCAQVARFQWERVPGPGVVEVEM